MATMLDETTRQVDAAADEYRPTLRRFSVCDYHKMIDAGLFTPHEHVELIKGVLVKMSPKGKRHAATTNRITKVFLKTLGERVVVSNQNPILFDDATEPEPDIALLAPQEKEYFDRLPTPADVLLIIEVADTTLKYDREEKSLIYARAGIKHYIILSVKTREAIDMREPSPDGYRFSKTLRQDERFSLVAFPETEIAVGELLPPE